LLITTAVAGNGVNLSGPAALRATNRSPSQLLVVFMAIWVVSPFVALLWASIVSKGWSVLIVVAV
jgi:hypothetical protein